MSIYLQLECGWLLKIRLEFCRLFYKVAEYLNTQYVSGQNRTFFHHQVIGLARKTSCSKSVLYNTLNQIPKWLNKILQLHWVSFNGDRIIFKNFQTIRDFPCKNTFNVGGFLYYSESRQIILYLIKKSLKF